MKIVYTPKNPLITLNASINMDVYNCEAYEYFKKKRKNDLSEIVNEINRRQKEKYNLPSI